jgi:hypothetical protein
MCGREFVDGFFSLGGELNMPASSVVGGCLSTNELLRDQPIDNVNGGMMSDLKPLAQL